MNCEAEKKKSTISVIIEDAERRTQKLFQRGGGRKKQAKEKTSGRKKLKKEQAIVIEEEQREPSLPQKPSPPEKPITYLEILEQTPINFQIQPLLDLKCDAVKPILPEDIQSDQITFDLEDLLNIQKKFIEDKIRERKEQQKKRFDFYFSLKQEDKLYDMDYQIDETFSYTYTIPSSKQSQIELKYFDFTKLNHYVNDTIINFFLKFLQYEIVNPHDQEKFLIFSTYHTAKIVPFEQISQINQLDQQSLANEFYKNYQTILKWTKSDIFTKQYIMFPLHLKEHWSLMIVVDAKQICNDMLQGNNRNTVSFIYLDSYHILDDRIFYMLKLFLLQIYAHQNNLQITQDQIIKCVKSTTIICQQPLVPRQINYIDCGVHLLEYAESFMMNPEPFIQKLSQKSGWNQLDWFPRIIVVTKRLLIKRLLFNLLNYEKERAVATYNKERNNIYQEFKNKPTEYDVFDEFEFEECFQEKQGSKQVLRLEFYLNDDYNFYYPD